MSILQILALPSFRLGLLKSLENYNTYIVNIQYKCQSMGECIPTHSIVIIHSIHQQNKYSHHILKCVDIALPSSKNTLPCFENEFIGNTWIYNPMLHYLYLLKVVFILRTTKIIISTSKWQIPYWKVMGWAILSYITTKSHCVPCNIWNSMQYEKACSLTLNYYTLIVWISMVLLVHKDSKSTNEFTSFVVN